MRGEPGFEGVLSNLSLPDLLQLHGHNRFSGSISVSNEGLEGVIFLQQGDVVHAEAGALRGEDAVCAILGWRTGNFVAHPNVSTFARTVSKGLDHLLLEAHRRIDELRKAGAGGAAPPGARSAPARRPTAPAVVARVSAIPGVAYAAMFNRDGVPVGDRSPAAEALAARSLFLVSTLTGPLGQQLGLGELLLAAVSSPGAQLLLFQSRDTYLAASVSDGSSLADAEAGIRRALAPAPGGR